MGKYGTKLTNHESVSNISTLNGLIFLVLNNFIISLQLKLPSLQGNFTEFSGGVCFIDLSNF